MHAHADGLLMQIMSKPVREPRALTVAGSSMFGDVLLQMLGGSESAQFPSMSLQLSCVGLSERSLNPRLLTRNCLYPDFPELFESWAVLYGYRMLPALLLS